MKNSTAPAKKILIADDDRDTVSLLQFVFEAEGYKTFTASDGLHAITQARHHLPDSIILDISLASVNGFEVSKQLRSYGEFSQTTIIAYTGHGQDDILEKAEQAGIDYYLLKPAGADVLLACIDPENHAEAAVEKVTEYSGLTGKSLELQGQSLAVSATARALSERSRKAISKARELCKRHWK